MFRCSMPVFTCVLEFLIHGTVRPLPVYLSLIPVICGTMLVCLGDVSFQWIINTYRFMDHHLVLSYCLLVVPFLL